MTVYTEWQRTDSSPQRATETQAGFLDRIAGPYWDQVRDVINAWCSHLPVDVQPTFRSRLLDRNVDVNVHSALWELYLHEMLLGSGYTVEVEPDIGTRGRKPDFLVSRSGEQFVIEAIWTAERIDDPRHGRLAAQLREAIEKNIQSPDFVLSVMINTTGPTLPSQKRLKAELTRWLSELDPSQATGLLKRERSPRHTWREAAWSITFSAIPCRRGSQTGRVISIYPGVSLFRIDSSSVLDAVKKKGTRYGNLEMPYIVAVGVAGPFVEDDNIETSLYGDGYSDGYWNPARDDEHTVVSGVLTVDNPAPWAWAKKSPVLWLNPQLGSLPAPVLPTWATARFVGAEVERRPAVAAPHTAVGLTENWPLGDPFPRAKLVADSVSARPASDD